MIKFNFPLNHLDYIINDDGHVRYFMDNYWQTSVVRHVDMCDSFINSIYETHANVQLARFIKHLWAESRKPKHAVEVF